jgi:Cys-tRNA(Pro) deacylase
MAVKETEYPVTQAVRFLRAHKVEFKPHLYNYEERGGTRVGSVALGVPEHMLVKTLVMETDQRKPFLVLMHGDREVSTRQLSRVIGSKSVSPCDERTATKVTGYIFGGTSPFGTRTPLPVYAEKSMFELPSIFINGGKRGFLVEIDPHALRRVLPVTEVEVAVQ